MFALSSLFALAGIIFSVISGLVGFAASILVCLACIKYLKQK